MTKKTLLTLIVALVEIPACLGQTKWTLQECIDYALEHNIQIKQSRLTAAAAEEDELAAKADLLPSLSANTTQNVTYRPNAMQTINLSNGTMTTSRRTTSYNGNYGVSANWTVWNGGRNTKTIRQSRLTREMADLQTQETANSIQEQITQLFVQVLYETEAVEVDSTIVEASKAQRDRAKERVLIGDLSKVDLAQLEAQLTQDQYTLVTAKTRVENYKLQLKQLLELPGESTFDVAVPLTSDDAVMYPIPSKNTVYASALDLRPEIKSGKLSVQSSNLGIDIARAGYMPTISLNGGINSSNANGVGSGFGTQISDNWSNTVGLTVSVPLFDKRQTKSAVEKAKISAENSVLQLQSDQKKLYSTIENYWLQAVSAQQQFVAAKANVASAQMSYDLLSEQFNLRMKNIVELTTGMNALLQAKQDMLQSKYTTLYNLAMLRFYQGMPITLR